MNGYTNWATWQVNLWVSNDEQTYKAWDGMVQSNKPLTATTAMMIGSSLYPEGTPDMADMNADKEMNSVDWEELATVWNED